MAFYFVSPLFEEEGVKEFLDLADMHRDYARQCLETAKDELRMGLFLDPFELISLYKDHVIHSMKSRCNKTEADVRMDSLRQQGIEHLIS